MIISMVFFFFIRVDNMALKLVLRIALVPVIAGISYEIIRLAGRSDNIVVRIISAPGLWMQKLTTKEPDEDMIEVAIASVEAVFDWKAYLKETFGYEVDTAGCRIQLRQKSLSRVMNMTYKNYMNMERSSWKMQELKRLHWMPDCFWNIFAIQTGMRCWFMETCAK